MKSYSKVEKTAYTEKQLKKILVLAIENLGILRATAAVFLVRSADLKKMKSHYYKKGGSRVADVLSFAEPRGFPHPESKKRFLGEIYLNESLKSDPGRLKFLLIHGLLHLVGFTHDKNRDTIKMQSLEKRLMDKISKRF